MDCKKILYLHIFEINNSFSFVWGAYNNYIPIDGYANYSNISNSTELVPFTDFKVVIIGNGALDFVTVSLLLIMQLCIACYVKEYYDLLPSEQEKSQVILSSL